MTFDLSMPLLPELALFALAILVLLAGLTSAGRAVGWITFIGLVVVFALTLVAEEGREAFSGFFVQDAFAIFAKRLFVFATIISLLGSLTLGQPTFTRRTGEYHFALLVSLLGMAVLASARPKRWANGSP